MKKLLTILLSILSLTIMAQVPQGVGYQGVATDANGIELVNQSISIKASVLNGSANGNIEWEETHATSTDTFGLFTLTIGQGTNTTNGLQTSFADISWGTNTHFLKIEMDVTGGTNYSFMGTNQMMSVPYALYAENANINYDSISNFLSGDSTFITTVGGGMGGDGCNFKFPEGYDGEGISVQINNSNKYTVPTGKRLYITNSYGSNSYFNITGIGDLFYAPGQQYGFSMPIIINSGQQIESNNSNWITVNGYLVDENPDVEGVSVQINNSNKYTVPTGKRLYITNSYGSNSYFNITGIGDLLYAPGQQYGISMPIIINSGQQIESNNSNWITVNGYLVDENYFAACGGGGGSNSTSSLDSTAIANMIAGAGGSGGCNFKYPDGLHGNAITEGVDSYGNTYTVPVGKRLYVLGWLSSSPTIDGQSLSFPDGKPLILNAGQILANLNGYSGFNGYLVDEKTEINAITEGVDSYGNTYTVPVGKRLYVLGWLSSSPTIDGQSLSFSDGNPLILNAGQILANLGGYSGFNGYLADENYFAGCGGGGSSSATSSLDSTTIANMIAAAGGGCNMLFPEGVTGESITFQVNNSINYQVPTGKKLYVLNWKHYDPIIEGFRTNTPQAMPLILNEGEYLNGNDASTQFLSTFNGLLISSSSEVNAITGQVSNTIDYEVPAGKKLYVLNWYSDDPLINGKKVSAPSGIPFILNAGEYLSGDISTLSTFNGYLVDENYFAGCGGGSSSSTSNSNTSGSNPAIGIGSITDLDDFDKEYDMFNAQLSGDFKWDKTNIHYDQLNNIYIIGAYSTNYNNSIAGTSLHYTSNVGYETFFIAKYDSSGNMQYVISEPVPSASSDNYYYRSSMVDDYGNIFVGGRFIGGSSSYHTFIRKYSAIDLSFVDEQLSLGSGNWTNQINDIVSDGSGGAYFVGSYKYAITLGTVTLPSDANNYDQGFVAHWDNSGIIAWANSIGDLTLSNCDDYASSITVDQNNNIFVAGRFTLVPTGTYEYKTFIKKYNTSGQLITTVESDFMSYSIPLANGVKVNVDNNGNVYLFTSHNVTTEDPNYVFNSFSLTPIISNSKILYKMDNNLSVLDAINFATNTVTTNQIIVLSNNDVILRSIDQNPYIINNIIYEQDVIQYGNLTHLDSNNDFVKFHTLGSTIGSTYSSSITANTNTIYTLYYRVGPVTNNGTTHPSGYYVVKEQY